MGKSIILGLPNGTGLPPKPANESTKYLGWDGLGNKQWKDVEIPSYTAGTGIIITDSEISTTAQENVIEDIKVNNVSLSITDKSVNITKNGLGLENVANPTFYGGISYGGGADESGVSFTDLNSLLYSGFYTCYGTTANVPSSSTSWFIEHINSNVGTATATQFAYAYSDNKVIYKRTKTSGTWGSWEKINLPSRIQNSDNTSYFEAGGNVNNNIIGVGRQESLFKQLSNYFELSRTRNYGSYPTTNQLATIILKTNGTSTSYNDNLEIEVSSTVDDTESYIFDGQIASVNENKVAQIKDITSAIGDINTILDEINGEVV